jgi:hypothetical protein
MRVTVGGFLVVGAVVGIGAYFALGPLQSLSSGLLKKNPKTKTELSKPPSVHVASSSVTVPSILSSQTEAVPLNAQTSTAVVPSAPTVPRETEVNAMPAEEKAAVVPPLPPAKKLKRRHHRKKVSAIKKNGNKAVPASTDSLVGTLVVLKLKSGRDATGILLSKSDTSYKIELPGLGPFEYGVDDVASVQPAK